MPPRKRTTTRAPAHSATNSNRDNPHNPENPQVDLTQLVQLLQQQTATLAQQQQIIQTQQQQLQQQPPNQPVVNFKAFQAVKPPEFQGSTDPTEAQKWLKEIEKAFVLIQVSEEQKTNFASYMLKGEANYWWEATKALEEEELVTWDRFKQLFLEQYFPRYMKAQMELKFFELKQNNMSVAEYEKKFTELARFVPEYVDSEEKKARRFQQGLKPWIRGRIAMLELNTYAEVMQKAIIVEGESDQSQKERFDKKRKFGQRDEGSSQDVVTNKFVKKSGFQIPSGVGRFQKNNNNRNQGNRMQIQGQQQKTQQMVVPECKICLKKHTGECRKAGIVCYKCNARGHYSKECPNASQVQRTNVTCFKCGKVGHISKDCKVPMKNNNLMRMATAPTPYFVQPAPSMVSYDSVPQAPGQRLLGYQDPIPSDQVRTLNMSMTDTVQSSEVVAGTLLVNSISAKVLIDTGATRSFISKEFAGKLGCATLRLEGMLNIVLANQE